MIGQTGTNAAQNVTRKAMNIISPYGTNTTREGFKMTPQTFSITAEQLHKIVMKHCHANMTMEQCRNLESAILKSLTRCKSEAGLVNALEGALEWMGWQPQSEERMELMTTARDKVKKALEAHRKALIEAGGGGK
jgi:hypothetical protein